MIGCLPIPDRLVKVTFSLVGINDDPVMKRRNVCSSSIDIATADVLL